MFKSLLSLTYQNVFVQIDWHNFVVVETVDYQPWEVGNFPPPTNPSEVGARVLIQRRQEESGPATAEAAADSDSDDDDEEPEAANNNAGADTQVSEIV